MTTPKVIGACTLLGRVAEAIQAVRPVDFGREILIAAGTLISLITSNSHEGKPYELYSALEGTIVDSEPNFVKAVVEPSAPGESSPSCFKVSSLRLSETILTFLRLRMKPVEEAPTKRGRSNGRQAPRMPIEDSTMDQYTRGEFMSAGLN